MAKETRKQIIEQTRNEVAKKYKDEIKNMQERINKLADMFNNEQKLRLSFQNKVESLEDKVRQYEDWIERLQSFMDMPEDEREKEFATMKLKRETAEKMKYLTDFYTRYLHF